MRRLPGFLCKLAFAICGILCLQSSAAAQDTPRVEVFGGYSFTRINAADDLRLNANGWNGSVSINATHYFGVTFDVSGHYTTQFNTSPLPVDADTGRVRLYRALVGPRLVGRNRSATMFLHGLFGLGHGRFQQRSLGRTVSDFSEDKFALVVGGGIDLSLHRNLAFRAIQAEYAPTHFRAFFENRTQNNFRLSLGVVIRGGY